MTNKLYIKDGKQAYNFFGHSKLKPIGYVALFKLQDESATLTENIASSTVAQTKKRKILNILQVTENVSLSIKLNRNKTRNSIN